jgi:hypothetical protein
MHQFRLPLRGEGVKLNSRAVYISKMENGKAGKPIKPKPEKLEVE